jgi:HK97 family phage prohead protease
MTLALCGYVNVYDKVIFHDGVWQKIMPGCFAKSLTGRISLLLNHQPELLVGTNRDGCLELYSDDIGLAMRAILPNTKHGKTARWMGNNGHTAASICFDHGAKTETRQIDGKNVVCFHEARLTEVSYLFCKLGAFKETFLTYRDCDFTKSLREESKTFAYDGAAIGVTRALEI